MEQKYTLNERFADNGEHSHWELTDIKTGAAVWSEGEDEHEHAEIFSRYQYLKNLIGTLGYNTFIHSKEVEEYRAWLRNDRYKHRLEWFEKEYPNGLYYKEDGTEYGVSLMTKKFLAEADAAYELSPANIEHGATKEEILDSIVRNWSAPITRQDAYEAMEQYARLGSNKPVAGPWKYEVHHVQHQEDADEYATISDGKVTLYIDGGQDDGDEQRLVNLLNQLKIKLDYDHAAEFVASEYERMNKEGSDFIRQIGLLIGAPNPYAYTVDDVREAMRQEGPRWVKAESELPKTYWRGPVITQRPDGTTAIKLSTLTDHGWIIDDRFNDEWVIAWLSESPISTKEREIAFAEWTAKGLWSTYDGMWYEYQNEDNPISGEQLHALYQQSLTNKQTT